MKRFIIAVILVGIIYVVGTLVIKEIGTFVQNATLILHGTSRTMLTEHVRSYAENSLGETLPADAHIEIRLAHIDTDPRKDIIATIASDSMCGSGGCMTLIMLLDTETDKANVVFAYVVKEIQIENSTTNGMHDVRINDTVENVMKWDGEQYTLNSF